MADQYRHGAWGFLGESRSEAATKVVTAPVYICAAPVHMLADYEGKVNRPIQVTSYPDAVRKVGYSRDWKSFGASEIVSAHFQNGIEPIGPVYLINVFDPDTMRGNTQETVSVNLIGGTGRIPNDKIIRNTVNIAGMIENVDYFLDYDTGKGELIIRDIGGSLSSPVTVQFYEADPSQVTEAEIIGAISGNGDATGVFAARYLYQMYNVVPTILAAPGWSHMAEVGAALRANAQSINGHWNAFVYDDLPAEDAAQHGIDKIVAIKQQMGYRGENEAPNWPRAKKNGKIYHLSTIHVVRTMQTDRQNNGIPYETGSNKPIDIDALCFEDGTEILFDQEQANSLNASGITTAIYWGGRWVLWGPHTGNFFYNSDNDVRGIFEPYMRMLYYILNSFQLVEGPEVDRPMDRRLKDAILLRWQSRLDGLANIGAILYGKIDFRPEDNVTSDLINGDFLFDIELTVTPPAKSIGARVSWTDKGLRAYFDELQEVSGL